MAEGKWISDLRPDTPLADAARHVLTVRLEAVRDRLPPALHSAEDDPEHVHQLRVATRRAAAALRLFDVCLPTKGSKKARKQLRQVRRAAGEARDWDVFLAELTAWGEKHHADQRPGIDFLLGFAFGQRAAAQEHLQNAAAEYPFTFDRFIADTVAAVHRPREPRLSALIDLARPLLSELLRELDVAASRDLADYGNLHQVRIAGKRLRYAMELFVECFGERFRTEIYPAVEELQEVLGRANDSHVAAGRLENLRRHLRANRPAEWKRFRPGVEGLLRYHRQRLPRERKHFGAWWRRWHRSGVEAALTELLMPADAALTEG